jgi:cysteine-rich repeat protein
MREAREECDAGSGNADNGACTTRCKLAACGDGVIWADEEACDDGDKSDDDACTHLCKVAACGDGILSAPKEQCDDGNDVDTDGCTSGCIVATCGDGVVHQGVEQCDDGNGSDEDGCVGCQVARCGDGFTRAGTEACDDANVTDTDGCTSQCTVARCGDGFVQTGKEECDDGNGRTGDGCDAECVFEAGWSCSPACKEICGDAILVGREQCHLGVDGCDTNCTFVACGNGVISTGEGCDDGNLSDGDGCGGACQVEPGWDCTTAPCSPLCGNGRVDGGEACDGDSGCDPNCTFAVCGNAWMGGVEECDDGNVAAGDGCSPSCATESGWACDADGQRCTRATYSKGFAGAWSAALAVEQHDAGLLVIGDDSHALLFDADDRPLAHAAWPEVGCAEMLATTLDQERVYALCQDPQGITNLVVLDGKLSLSYVASFGSIGAREVAAAGDGTVWMLGDLGLLALKADGSTLLHRELDVQSPFARLKARRIAADTQHFWLAGGYAAMGSDLSPLIVKATRGGDIVWQKTLGLSGEVTAIAARSGELFITGSRGEEGAFVARMSDKGALLWSTALAAAAYAHLLATDEALYLADGDRLARLSLEGQVEATLKFNDASIRSLAPSTRQPGRVLLAGTHKGSPWLMKLLPDLSVVGHCPGATTPALGFSDLVASVKDARIGIHAAHSPAHVQLIDAKLTEGAPSAVANRCD